MLKSFLLNASDYLKDLIRLLIIYGICMRKIEDIYSHICLGLEPNI